MTFHGYGSNYIKKSSHSPDAFVQLAMQLATFRLFKRQAGTYEASQVRTFLHGRTETTRSVSNASADFLENMGSYPKGDELDGKKRKEKLLLLKNATEEHAKYIGYAGKGLGVDRHFLGLSLLVEPGEPLPDLYNDPVFQRSKRWRVSTSNIGHPKFINGGYGEVVPDGVGLRYMINPEKLTLILTGGCP